MRSGSSGSIHGGEFKRSRRYDSRMNAELKTDPDSLIAAGRRAHSRSRSAPLRRCAPRLDAAFARACAMCLDCRGRVIVTGMGKSGHIAGKIAATLASTGTPSFFMHAAEASHGDIGMITREDVLLAISNSGETAEVLLLIPHLSRLGVPHHRHDRQRQVQSRARRHRASRRERGRGSLPAQSRAHGQHHRDARARRCAGRRAARSARLHVAGFRALASRRRARAQTAAARRGHHAHRRRTAGS